MYKTLLPLLFLPLITSLTIPIPTRTTADSDTIFNKTINSGVIFSINPPPNFDVSTYNSTGVVRFFCETNAECLQKGLPILKPRLGGGGAFDAAQSGTAFSYYTGYVVVSDDGGNELGYLSDVLNQFGEYGALTNDTTQALILNFLASPSGLSTQISINIDPSTQEAPYQFIGGITGFANSNDNLLAGSYNYAYMVPSSARTPAGSTPYPLVPNAFTASTGLPEDCENSIWTFNPSTNELVPQWINTDGSSPISNLLLTQGALLITGDVSTFEAAFGTATSVTLTFQPLPKSR